VWYALGAMKKTTNGDNDGYASLGLPIAVKRRLERVARVTRRGIKDTVSWLLDLAETDSEYQAVKARYELAEASTLDDSKDITGESSG